MANGAGFNRMSVPGAQQTRTVWEHQSLKFDHNGTQIEIHPDGKCTLTTVSPDPENAPDGIITDVVTVSASVIFKAAGALKMTRSEKQVPVEKAG